MDFLRKVKEARRYIVLNSQTNIMSDAFGDKYVMAINKAPTLFLEAMSQITRDKNTRISLYVQKEKKIYDFTPAKDRKNVYISVDDKLYTMTEDLMLLENTTPTDIKNMYHNTPNNWFGIEK